MAWSNLNYYRLTGTITSGITLDVNNPKSGTAPVGYLTYDDVNYDSTTYAFGAYFYGEYASSITNNRVTIPITGTAAHFNVRYAGSPTGTVYDAWATLAVSSGDNQVNINYPYFKIEIKIDNYLWSDADGFYVSSILPYYSIFQKYTTISAAQMNGNFNFVGAGDLIPRGGINLDPTTGAYDLGSDVYKWKTVYAENAIINTLSTTAQAFSRIAYVDISTPATSIEFTGLNGDAARMYGVRGQLIFGGYSSPGVLALIFNGDTTAAYYSGRKIWQSSSTVSFTTTSKCVLCDNYKTVNFDSYIGSETGIRRHLCAYMMTDDETTYKIVWVSDFWNNTTDTITSIKIYATGNVTITAGKLELYALR